MLNKLGTIIMNEIADKNNQMRDFKLKADEYKKFVETYEARANRCKREMKELEDALELLTKPIKAKKLRKAA